MIANKLPKRAVFWVCPNRIPQTQWDVWRVTDQRGIGRKGNVIVASFPPDNDGFAKAEEAAAQAAKFEAAICY